MIGTYSTNFGNAAQLAAMLRDQGLEVAFTKYFFGCATSVAGRKAGPIGGGACAHSRLSLRGAIRRCMSAQPASELSR